MAENKKLKLSASRLKTFQACSWQYWARYHLKLPDEANSGALMGTCCHSVFECLLNSRHKKLYDLILAKPATIENSKAVTRYVNKYIKRWQLDPDIAFEKIDSMIIVGLVTDFFCKGGELLAPEYEFTLENKKPRYLIGGLIDKAVKYNEKYLRVADYKSSKKKFVGEELIVNVQAMMYSLAAKKLWPHLIPIVDFIFLQFPKEPIQRLKFSDDQLKGFEIFLAQVYAQMEKFTNEDATKNFAARQKAPKEGFKGPLLCGWNFKQGFVKKEGELKKDGVTPKFVCSYRFPFDYWALCDEDGKVIKTSKKNNLLAQESKGQFVVKKRYGGCPAFIK